MELNLITGNSQTFSTKNNPVTMTDTAVSTSSGSNVKAFISQEKTMMDLKDVQAFLYMMIGSDVKITQDSAHSIGSGLNKTA
jgi:hypothetical protein